MKKHFSITLLLLLASCYTDAQLNLVSNPGFDILVNNSQCPYYTDQLNFCAGWTSISGTPDYFNVCGTSPFSVPSNYVGQQNASGSQGYAGFLTVSITQAGGLLDYREYISTKLIQPLIIGKRYFLTMHVSLAERWLNTDTISPWNRPGQTDEAISMHPTYLPSNKMGMKFCSTGANALGFYDNYPHPLMNNTAHLYSQTIISDTTNWT